MSGEATSARGWQADPAAGRIAIVSGIIAAVGVVCLALLYVLYFATPLKDLGSFFGGLNDALIVIQYLLAIPLALALRPILRPHAPTRIEVATFPNRRTNDSSAIPVVDPKRADSTVRGARRQARAPERPLGSPWNSGRGSPARLPFRMVRRATPSWQRLLVTCSSCCHA